MRAKEFLSESHLKRGDFYKADRIQTFIDKMVNQSPFELVGGGVVTLKHDPALVAALKKVQPMVQRTNASTLVPLPDLLDAEDAQGQEQLIRLSALKKTLEFGTKEKEQTPIKSGQLPSLSGTGPAAKIDLSNPEMVKNILQTDAFLASELGNRIINDPVLNTRAGQLGQVIIDLARQSQAKPPQVPVLPQGLSADAQNAIRDYAGEYLGIMQLVNGTAKFDNIQPFLEHLGTTDLTGLKIYFPRASNTPLADSLGTMDTGIAAVQSAQGTVMKISSKGNKIGAPPSLDNLNPDLVRDKKYARHVVGFIDVARKFSAKEQPFRLMNYLYTVPEVATSLDTKIKKMLPFSDKEITDIMNSHDVPMTNLARDLAAMAGDIKGTVHGKCHYVVNKEVIRLVNNANALPNLKKTVLEILGSNFVQLYSTIEGNQLRTRVLWPNKVDGDVYLYSKSYASNPSKGKLSFYVST